MKKLSITDGTMFSLLQAYVGLGYDDPNNIWLEEVHLKQLLDCWLHVCVEAQACLVLPSTFNAVEETLRMLPVGKELC